MVLVSGRFSRRSAQVFFWPARFSFRSRPCFQPITLHLLPLWLPMVSKLSRFIQEGMNAATAASKPSVRVDKQAGQLFGLKRNLLPRASCRHVEVAIAQDFAVVAQCHANGTCPVAAQRLIDISAKGAGRSGRARVGLIDRAADLGIGPVRDEIQWGVADHRSDPFETLLLNHGDCDDYAILKYGCTTVRQALPRTM